MDWSTSSIPVLHNLPEFAQIHVHWMVMPSNHLVDAINRLGDAIQPLSSPSCQSFSASGSFLMNQLYASGGQSTGASTSASVLLMNIQDWFPLGWTGLISLQSKELSSLLQYHSSKALFMCFKINSLTVNLLYGPTLKYIHDYQKNHSFDYMELCWQSCLLSYMLPRFVIAFLPRSKRLLISWLRSPSAVISEPKKIKIRYSFHQQETMTSASPTLEWEEDKRGSWLCVSTLSTKTFLAKKVNPSSFHPNQIRQSDYSEDNSSWSHNLRTSKKVIRPFQNSNWIVNSTRGEIKVYVYIL